MLRSHIVKHVMWLLETTPQQRYNAAIADAMRAGTASAATSTSSSTSTSYSSSSAGTARSIRTSSIASAATPAAATSASSRPPTEDQDAGAPTTRQPNRPLIFSIRPSALSPLHPIYRAEQDLAQRGDYLRTVASAHQELSQQLAATSDSGVAAELAARRAGLQAVVEAYEPVAKADKLPQCGEHGLSQGYYWLLEQKAQMQDEDFLQFNKVLAGDVNVWDYWFSHFTVPYRGLPSMEPLETIFSRDDPTQEARRLRRQALRQLAQPATGPRQPQVDDAGRARAIGRRKTSSAKVFVWPGDGRMLVNMLPVDEYFHDVHVRHHALKSLMVAGAVGRVNVLAQVSGGGISGQAQAVAHGIARALQNLDPASYRKPLKEAGLLKRDPRMVERKKPGKAKARRSFAWVKR